MWSLRPAFARLLVAGALAMPTAAVFVPSDAAASVSIAVGFDALIKDADVVAVITPVEQQSIWEDGRIYTYTRVKVDQSVAGEVGNGAEGWVRTMGGVVGKIGQLVDGEPVFVTGKSSLLFLRKFKDGAVYEVAARAQGQYPVIVDDVTKAKKVVRSMNAGVILPPKKPVEVTPPVQTQSHPQSSGLAEPAKPQMRLAQEAIHDRSLDDVTREVATTWKRLHPIVVTPTK
jgi:hypothetical protein